MKTSYIIILVTCCCRKEAEIIADALLKKRLVACANIAAKIESKFWWNNKIDRAREALLMCKTVAGRFAAVEKEVRRLHSYEVPEVIALPIVAGSPRYLSWIKESVSKKIV